MAMRFLACFLVLGLGFGCGGDDADDTPDAGLGGFAPPDVIAHAYEENDDVYTDLGEADFSCLNTATDDAATSVEVALTGTIGDFQTGDDAPEVTAEAFKLIDWQNPFATATSDDDGNYAMTVPIGVTRFGFKMTSEDIMDTFLLNQYVEPDQAEQRLSIDSVSILTANALPAFIGVTRTPGLGIVAGAMRDCQDREVKGTIATVSSVSGTATHLAGATTYYFSAGSTTLPVRHVQQPYTNGDGLFMTIEVPTTASAFLQVWGFISGQDPAVDELTLLAEIPTPVLEDTVVTFSLEPLRTN
jgi:hypothetical protein